MIPARPDPGWIARYFIDPPDPQDLRAAKVKLACGGAGLLPAFLVMTMAPPFFGFLGLVGCVVGAVLLFKGVSAKQAYVAAHARALPRPTDADIDQILMADTRSVVDRALPQLGLTRHDLVAPPGVSGPASAFDGLPAEDGSAAVERPGASQMLVSGPALPCRLSIGQDGRLRYSEYEFMVICPTDEHFAVYRCELDLCTGRLSSQHAHKFHYADVVAVRTRSHPLHGRTDVPIRPRPSQQHLSGRLDTVRTMEIVVSSGDHTSVTTGVSSSADGTVDSDGSDAPPEFRDVLQRVRQLLREKNGGAPSPQDGR